MPLDGRSFWTRGVCREGRLGLCRWGWRWMRRVVLGWSGGVFERPLFALD